MKEIKFLLILLSVAAYTSVWWIALMFKSEPALAVAIISSIVILILAGIYIENHWSDG